MDKEILTFSDTEIKVPFFLEDVDIDKLLVSHKNTLLVNCIMIIKLNH